MDWACRSHRRLEDGRLQLLPRYNRTWIGPSRKSISKSTPGSPPNRGQCTHYYGLQTLRIASPSAHPHRQRIGLRISTGSRKVAAVLTDSPDRNSAFKLRRSSRRIADTILDFPDGSEKGVFAFASPAAIGVGKYCQRASWPAGRSFENMTPPSDSGRHDQLLPAASSPAPRPLRFLP